MSIIENFRNFARKSSGRTVAEVNIKAVAVRIARLLSQSALSAGISLRIRKMDALPCPWMNENDLEQLFFALIGNAIQAADGKKNRQLVISGAVKDQHIELRLSDDCGGIGPENIDKIFEPFFTTKPRGQERRLLSKYPSKKTKSLNPVQFDKIRLINQNFQPILLKPWANRIII